MAFLGSIVQKMAQWLWKALWSINETLVKFNAAVWAFIVLVVGWVWVIIKHSDKLFEVIKGAFESITPGAWAIDLTPPPAVTQVIALSNTFFPLNEAVAFTVLYFTLKVALAVIRFVKSFIPSLAGS